MVFLLYLKGSFCLATLLKHFNLMYAFLTHIKLYFVCTHSFLFNN